MRLIDADALKERTTTICSGGKWTTKIVDVFIKWFKEFVDVAPTVDAEPVIRCKDCIFFSIETGFCARHCYHGAVASDYCSQAEPKTE